MEFKVGTIVKFVNNRGGIFVKLGSKAVILEKSQLGPSKFVFVRWITGNKVGIPYWFFSSQFTKIAKIGEQLLFSFMDDESNH